MAKKEAPSSSSGASSSSAAAAAAAAAASLLSSLVLDTTYSITLSDNSTMEATLLSVDDKAGALALVEGGTQPGTVNIRVVPVSGLALGTPPRALGGRSTALTPALNLLGEVGGIVDMEQARKKEEEMLRNARDRASKLNGKVDGATQALFDALSKTMACAWSNVSIVVLGEVIIDPPYTSDVVRGLARDTPPNTVLRVKKVIQGARAKLGLD